MLKIEVIKFEALDVITASTPAPVEQKCICPEITSGSCEVCLAQACPGNPDGSHNCDHEVN